MNDASGRSGGKVFLAFTLGALVGAAAAVLFAPASGEETRKRIKDFTEDVTGKAGGYVSDAKKRVNDGLSRGKEAISDRKNMIKSAIEAGKDAYAKEKDRVERGDEA
ncbi:MAG: YtxH domain-containing protein [Nitrospiraceae bacterium]|nr:YtxH domain-containing protein [Nitrospiraceae bacterium]